MWYIRGQDIHVRVAVKIQVQIPQPEVYIKKVGVHVLW